MALNEILLNIYTVFRQLQEMDVVWMGLCRGFEGRGRLCGYLSAVAGCRFPQNPGNSLKERTVTPWHGSGGNLFFVKITGFGLALAGAVYARSLS
jgi:hypothetical protein